MGVYQISSTKKKKLKDDNMEIETLSEVSNRKRRHDEKKAATDEIKIKMLMRQETREVLSRSETAEKQKTLAPIMYRMREGWAMITTANVQLDELYKKGVNASPTLTNKIINHHMSPLSRICMYYLKNDTSVNNAIIDQCKSSLFDVAVDEEKVKYFATLNTASGFVGSYLQIDQRQMIDN